MGNNTSADEAEEVPSVEYILSHGPHFDSDFPEIKEEPVVFPFENEEIWPKIQNTLSAPLDPSQTAIDNLQNTFQSLSDHNGSRFCQHLKHALTINDNKDVVSISSILSPSEAFTAFVTCFLEKTLPFIKELVLKMPDLLQNHGLKFMIPKMDQRICLQRKQIACILAGCFFDLIADHCGFGHELSSCGISGKFDCYMHYFEYVRNKGINSKWAQEEVIIYRKCLLPKDCNCLEHKQLLNNSTKLCDFKVFEREHTQPKRAFVKVMEEMKRAEKEQKGNMDEKNDDEESAKQPRNERIEDCFEGIHADFANMYIGGGVLNGGNVQEEIRFTVNLECIVSKLLCPHAMQNDEAIIILRSQQFCDYKGYGSRFICTGLVHREQERHKSVIVGIDAVNFFSRKKQYKLKYMMRELCKAYAGFSVDSASIIEQRLPIVATGNWGCGMFGGDPQFKAMLQWIAATLVQRDVWYYTFNDKRVEKKLKVIADMMLHKKVSIGQLWKILNTKRCDKDDTDIFEIIQRKLKMNKT